MRETFFKVLRLHTPDSNTEGSQFMNSELGEAYARNTDPDTSHQAARVVSAEQANDLERQVLAAIKAHPDGLTNH